MAKKHKENQAEQPNEAIAEVEGKPEQVDAPEHQPSENSDAHPEQQTEVETLRTQVEELEDRLKRSFAEQQNQRQRMLKDKVAADRYASAKIATDMLEAIDNLQRALDSVPVSLTDNQHVQNLSKGVEMVLNQMIQVLATHNIVQINPMGELLNYNLHETVAEVDDTTLPPQHVVDVLQVGYILHDRLLRPAKVVVSSGRGESAKSGEVDKQV